MLTLTSTPLRYRTDANSFDRDATHWRCTLNRIDGHGKSVAKMTVEYSMGSAHTKPPTVSDVIGSLYLDSQAPESYKDFCDEYGYDFDSMKANKIWKACRSITIRLRKLLGEGGVFLCHDGEAVQAGHPNMLLGWMHRTHSYSWGHALEHEGYSIVVPV